MSKKDSQNSKELSKEGSDPVLGEVVMLQIKEEATTSIILAVGGSKEA